jgi:membrane fusion protein (multidrug efflux system)
VVGSNWVVESGLQSGERVIVAGLQKVRPGAVVNPAEQGADAPAAQVPANNPANK